MLMGGRRNTVTQDEDQLRLLSIFHYVVAGLAALFALFPIFHLVFGLMFILSPQEVEGKGNLPPAWLGWIFVIMASVLMTLGWTFAGFVFAAGRFLARRKRYLFCLVMAGIECIFMPFGTVLGVFTIIVLMRKSVKQQFPANNPVEPTSALSVTRGLH
jgi:hypothetical protein